MPLVQTRGAASAQGFGEFAQASGPVIYIEDVFSTYLYTGNNAAQTITNGIDLSTKGGLVWIKNRTNSGGLHTLFDTARGVNKYLNTDSTDAQTTDAGMNFSFLSTGFSQNNLYTDTNASGSNYASWTFRKQPKFFDVVTYTGNGVDGRTISHSLGSTPGCVIVKRTDSTGYWAVRHRSGGGTNLLLNTTVAGDDATTYVDGNISGFSSTTFTVSLGTTINAVNASAATYVAYLFAHDAGGFGLTGTDNVISCGSYTGNGSATGPVVTLGYEPQWLMIKKSSSTGNWQILDDMRGLPVGSADATLQANLSNAESSVEYASPTATGFQITSTNTEVNTSAATYIYIAIRRGPMKVPTTGTSVFSPIAVNAMQNTQQTTNFPVDMQLIANSGGETRNFSAVDRLRGVSTNTTSTYRGNITSSVAVESTSVVFATQNWNSTGFQISANTAETTALFHSFKRAPSFFDEVCYTGTGANTTVTHNLGVAPEIWIVKGRSGATAWQIGSTSLANTEYVVLNTTAAKATGATRWNSTYPTSSVFSLGTATETNTSAATYVAYLFATCAGVSKVFSYTGNGSSQTINCGFTAGSRWIMIKRTDSTGDWYVWDSARGIIAGNDPHLSLNTTVAEVTTDDSVDTDNTGFIVNQLAATNINVTSATYIGIAIA